MSQEAPLPALHQNVAVLSRLLAGKYEAACACLVAGAPSPTHFLRFVECHLLAWYLVGVVDASGLRGVFAAEDLARLERATESRQAKQGLLIDELARLWPCFHERGIDLILLKGPYLAQRFFGGARQRGFFDLDLLVRPEQLRAAERLLAELGYERRSTMLFSRSLTMRFTHGFDFAKDGLGLDIHWSLGTHASYRIDRDRLWAASAVRRLGRDEIAVLSDEDALFFLLLSLFEDLDRGAVRVRSFVDVHAMLTELDAQIDWPSFWERRRSERAARICQTVLGLFFALFDVEERFPRAASMVAPFTAQIRSRPRDETAALIEARDGSVRNKLWAMRVYECPAAVSIAWWCVSLPFRLAVYHPGTWSRLATRVGAAIQTRRRPG